MNNELNNIFADVESETPIETCADNGEGLIVEIVNNSNGARGSYMVYPENTIDRVFEVTYEGEVDTLGIKKGIAQYGEQLIYECNGTTYSDRSLTVSEIGLVNGGKLLVNPSGTVA